MTESFEAWLPHYKTRPTHELFGSGALQLMNQLEHPAFYFTAYSKELFPRPKQVIPPRTSWDRPVLELLPCAERAAVYATEGDNA